MGITAWIAFALAYGLMAATPGPTTLLVVSYGLSHGRPTALAVVGGTGLGDATCATAALFGIGAVLAASATAFSILKIAGALYLVFLGVRIFRSPPLLRGEAPSVPRPLGRAFMHAYLTTVFNPKSVLFFMIFVPQFMNPRAPLAPQCVIMVATVLALGALVDGSYSLFAAHLRRFIQTRRAQRIINRMSGSLLIGEGIAAALWRSLVL